jgi:carbon-monoxide dehydrogenase large subunit
MIGASVKRREDPRLVTGRGTFSDDLKLPGLCYLVFVRSPYAHARVLAIDAARAQAHPGVVAVYTARHLEGKVGPIPLIRRPPGQNIRPPPVPPLAQERVLYQGEPVAAVVATSREAAYDAAELVEVEYEPLPALVDIGQATAQGAPTIHQDFPGNIAFHVRVGSGEVDRAFREAEVVVAQRMVNQRLLPCALEPRCLLAQYDPFSQRLTVWLTTQRPHHTRWFIAYLFGLPEHRIRVIAPDVGGAFGSKEPIYPDEVVTIFAALALQRPVKWTEDRRENFLATTHGRDQVAYLEAAARKDGTITALRATIYANMGTYLYPNSPGVPIARTAPLLPGAYAIQAVSVDVYGVFTNTTPTGPYRGAGRPEATYYIERLVDLVAHQLGLDPAEVRLRNFVPNHRFPYTTPTGLTYDSGNFEGCFQRTLALLGYQELRRRQQEGWQRGEYLGIGFSSYVELGGVVPSRQAAKEGSFGMWESAIVRFHPTGKVSVLVGTAPHGQGHETAFAQIAAHLLGVPLEDVEVVAGDTALAPFGFGTFGSRSLSVAGAAVAQACQKVIDKARSIAAHLLEAAPADIEFEGGRFFVRGAPSVAKTIQEVAFTAMMGWNLSEAGLEPGLEAQATFDPPNYTFSSGTHACLVRVDPETGQVRLERYLAVDDCGRLVNPLLVHGQVHGGVAQGIAQAL